MKILNRKATFDYTILEKFEVGIILTGAEVKAARAGQVDLHGTFARIMGSEVYLVNAKILPYEYARPDSFDSRRTRKLLMHKKQIISLKSKIEGANLTIVPISMYTKGSLIKLELALAKSKKKFDKKALLKKQDLDREIQETLKGNY
jgi:SsrA-binding protein